MLTDKDKRLIARALKVLEREYAYTVDADVSAFTSTTAAADFMRLKVGGYESEQFAVAFLTQRHALIACETMFTGTIDGASVWPREIVKRALQLNAAAVVFAHNHPSGVSEPSTADVRLTTRLVDALRLVDVRVLDHIIVGADSFSFAEKGLI